MSATDDPFEGTETYYAEHRPAYDPAAIRYLSSRFDLSAEDRALDLGSGPGHLAVELAAHAGDVIGMDPSIEMLRQARRRAREAGRENVAWVVGSDADVDGTVAPVRLTTIGRAFHRMHGEATLQRLHRVTEPGGGVALLTDAEWLTRGTRAWQDAVYATAERYLDDLPERTGPIEHDDPWDELLDEFGFADVETATFESEREWTVDGVVGYVFSLSFCSPARFGDDRAAFEAELRECLRERGAETFIEDAELRVVSGRKEPA